MPLNEFWIRPPAKPIEPSRGSVTGPLRFSDRLGSALPGGSASVTGLVSEASRSGVVATAEPIRELAGHVPAANAAGWHARASRLTSVPIAFGSVTTATAVEDCPAGTVITACSGAALPLPVFPRAPTVASRRGENFRPAQSVAW